MGEFDQFEANQKLPNDPMALILGIGSILFSVMGCCCGLFTVIPAIVMAIVGVIFANKDLKAYSLAPNIYNLTSYNNTKTARVLNIIGLVISGILGLISILWIVGALAQPEFLEEFRQQLENMQNGN